MNTQQYDILIRQLYGAVTSHEGWNRVIVLLRDLVDCGQATYLVHDKMLDRTLVSEQAVADSQFSRDYETHFFQIDPVRPVVVRLGVGEWFLDRKHLGLHGIEHNEFYQCFLRKYGLDTVMCSLLANNARYLTGIAFQGAPGDEGFTEHHLARIHPIVPHLLQASSMRMQFRELAASASLGQAVLDSLPEAILIVNRKADVLFANAAGACWLRASAQLLGQQRALQCENSRTAMARLADRICRKSPIPCCAVRSPDADTTYFIGLALPESHRIAAQFSEPVGLVVVRAARQQHADACLLFRSVFSVTDAEARFVEAMQHAPSVRHAAASLNITYETARSYLKSVYDKTGCHGQAALQHVWTVLTQGLPR